MPIQDMPAAGIARLLLADRNELSDDQADARDTFIRRIGGVVNAWHAVEMLCELEER